MLFGLAPLPIKTKMLKTIINLVGRIETDRKYQPPQEDSHYFTYKSQSDNQIKKSETIEKFLKNNKLN
jgi:hypothetical protein